MFPKQYWSQWSNWSVNFSRILVVPQGPQELINWWVPVRTASIIPLYPNLMFKKLKLVKELRQLTSHSNH